LIPLAFLTGGAIALAVLTTRTPEWYGKKRLTPEEQSQAADRLERKIVSLGNELGHQLNARPTTASSGTASSGTASSAPMPVPTGDANATPTANPKPDARVVLVLTEAELNAFYRKWITWDQLDKKIEPYVEAPEIRLLPGKIILGGNVTAARSIVWTTLVVTQNPGDDSPTVALGSVNAGALPLPAGVWAKWSKPLIDRVASDRETWKARAALAPASPEGIALASLDQFTRIIDGQSIRPVLFVRTSLGNRIMPVKLWQLDVQEGLMSMQVEVLDEAEAAKWLEELQKAK